MADAWGAKTPPRSSPRSTTEQLFDQTPTLHPRESAHCRVETDFPASSTDDGLRLARRHRLVGHGR
jgi:hypothetical protein